MDDTEEEQTAVEQERKPGRSGAVRGRHRRLPPSEGPVPRGPVVRPLPIVEEIDRRPLRPHRTWRDVPRPPRAAVLGTAALVLIAGGTFHLASTGGALDAGSDPGGAPISGASSSAGAGPASTRAPDAASSPVGESPRAGAGSPEGSASTESSSPGSSSTGPTETTAVLVHVSGAVADPGVVELRVGDRVDDAIAAAGGATPEADLDAVNLARPVQDGEQIRVPLPGEQVTAPPPAGAPETAEGTGGGSTGDGSGASGGTDAAQGAADERIDINTASAAQLEELPGVGPAIAQRIVEHREAEGPFASVDDLEDVPGIGPATLEKMRDRATV